MFSHALFGMLIQLLPGFVERKVNQTQAAYQYRVFKKLLKLSEILQFMDWFGFVCFFWNTKNNS